MATLALEIGDPQRFQPHYIRSTLVGVRSCLADMGMLPKRAVAPGPDPILCSRSHWLYTDHGGLLEVLPQVTDRVVQGEVIAQLRDIFGGLVREFHAPEDGVIVGRSVNPVGPTGARIAHLGIVARPDDALIGPATGGDSEDEGGEP